MAIVIQLLLALAPYLAPVVVALLTYLVMQAIGKLPAKERPVVAGIVQSSVSAVEQMAADQLNSAGKKQLAVELIEKQLDHYNIKVPESMVNSLIEETVLALNQTKQATAVVSTSLPIDKGETK